MVKCPRCFNQLDDRYVFACLSVNCATKKPDPVVTEQLGEGFTAEIGHRVELTRPVSNPNWIPPQGMNCPECRQPESEVCRFCHYPLPNGYHQGESICIAFAGARSTGKSLYIAVAVAYLKLFATEQMGWVLTEAANTKTKEIYQVNYERPLFEQRGMLAGTVRGHQLGAPQRDPLIYEVTGKRLTDRWFVVLRDVAGEDLQQPGQLPQHLNYLKRADTVLFLFDPLALKQVADRLHGIASHNVDGAYANTVLDNLANLIGAGTGHFVPDLGLVISKFDVLQELHRHEDKRWNAMWKNYGSCFVRDTSMDEPAYNEQEGELLDAEVKSLLSTLHAGSFLTRLNNSRLPYRFFVVSALGRPPKGDSLNAHGLSPFQVIRPIKWAMARRGLLPTKNG